MGAVVGGEPRLKFPSSVVRALLASAAVAGAIALAGCNTDGVSVAVPERALKPLSSEMTAALEKKSMPKDSPILVRLFKQESELEVWKQDTSGRFALLKSYPICRWSGELGPKVREGDRQAPEGFYPITPAQMNPNSNYYLSVNIGFPNEFDRAWGRTGDFLMIHGDCSSRGCYAMTDEQIAEIYALARESFFGGQRTFQVQAYPFRMTPLNMAKHRTNPNMAFWKMLKEGYDHFEVTRLEPKVDVCEKRYVFDAEPQPPTKPNATPVPLKFNAAARCPAYQVNPEIAAAVAEKSKQDEIETAELIRKGTPVAPIRTGADGGMHPVFQAALHQSQVGILDSEGGLRNLFDHKVPGTIPATVNPPRPIDPSTGVAVGTPPTPANPPARSGGYGLASAESKPAPQPQAGGRPVAADSGNMFTRLFSSDGDKNEKSEGGLTGSVAHLFGRGEDKKPPPPVASRTAPHPAAKPSQMAKAKPAPAAPPAGAPPATLAEPKAAPQPQYAAAKPPAPPVDPAGRTPAPNGDAGLLSNQPTAPVGTFDSRWSNWK
jgi:murein L,D-transpeptidase YafK